MAQTQSETTSPSLSMGHWIVDGTGWSFQAVVYDTTNIKHKNIILDTGNIVLFEYTNQWNALVLTGQLVYKDTERDMGKLFRIPHLIVRVEWAENEAEKKSRVDDEGIPQGDYWVEKPIKKEDYFEHLFLVNKMEIVDHDIHTDVTTYRLELVSASWYRLSSLCQYSNYNLKKPEPITDIICRLLVDAVGEKMVATKTFIQPPCKTDISIFYTTTQKDNYFTAINYLLNRMYMEPSSFDVDNHPRVIIWDEKERKYRMVNVNDDSTCLTNKDASLQLSRFYEISDRELNPYQPSAGNIHDIKPTIQSLSKMSYTRFVKDYYTRHYWDMNITKDKFVRRIIMNEKIHNVFKSTQVRPEIDTTVYPNPNFTAEESVPDLQSFLADKTHYLVDESKWNNERHLYNDCLHGMTSRDTFTLTRSNRICHQPWQCFYLVRDKESMKEKQYLDTDNLKLNEDESEMGDTIEPRTKPNDFGDNQFFGPWFTYMTTHTITVSGTQIEGSPTMVEKLYLIKPWMVTLIPHVLRK